MIRPIDIRLNAAHPELKLPESVTYTGSPSTVLIRGVPPNYGRWAITAVSVAATFPDGSTTTRAAVQSANGVWVATLPGTATSGRTTDGFRVLADGIDENGEAATGYILAVADFAVASLDVTPAPQPGETSYQMLYFDAVPGVLRKGDVTKVDGVLKFYNGEAWEAFATPPTLDDAVTRTSENGVKSSGIWSAIWGALTALPMGVSSLYDWCVAQLAGKVPTSRTVNGKALSSDVTLTGADIAVSGTDATKIDAALAGKQSALSAQQLANIAAVPDKLDKSGGTMTGGLTMDGGNLITFSDSSGTRTMTIGLSSDSFEINLYSYGTLVYTWRTPYNGGIFALASELSDKLDSTSAAPAFSSDSSVSYPVGSHCTYQGKLYKCTTATTGGTWVAGSWTADTMTDTIRYDRITITTGQLQDHAKQKVTLNAATTTLTLPALTTGKVSDFGIDVVNGYEVSGTPTAASFTLAGTIGTDYNIIVPEGEDWSEMSALAAGEMAVYYFTLSAFQINDKPTWEVMKKVVTLVPVPVAP